MGFKLPYILARILQEECVSSKNLSGRESWIYFYQGCVKKLATFFFQKRQDNHLKNMNSIVGR